MALDVYHQVLAKLYEVTDGKDSKAVNFKDLVKQLGFIGNYNPIFSFLSTEGWIVETPKADFVRITHWGVAEVKKSSSSSANIKETDPALRDEVNKTVAAAKQLINLLDKFAQNADQNSFAPVEKKLEDLQVLINQLKKSLS